MDTQRPARTATNRPISIVAIGGSIHPDSTVERVVRAAADHALRPGVEVTVLTGRELVLPLYDPRASRLAAQAESFLSYVSAADGLIIASPAYHGTVSGLVKNALDYVEELREDPRPYLSGRAVGCVTVASGWQGAASTLAGLRTVVHALRGWPTPLGVTVNSGRTRFNPAGECEDSTILDRLATVASQVVDFATVWRPRATAAGPSRRTEPAMQSVLD